MTYEVRNQHGNVPYVDGFNEAVISAHMNDKTSIEWDGEYIGILGYEAKDGKTIIKIHIEGI